MKIIFVTYDINVGGIASSLMGLISYLNRKYDNEISVMTIADRTDKTRYTDKIIFVQPPPLIRINNMNYPEVSKAKIKDRCVYLMLRLHSRIFGKQSTAKLVSLLSKSRVKYDIAISFANDIYSKSGVCLTCGCNQYVEYGVMATRKFAWVHANPLQIGYTGKIIEKTYRRFDKVINVSVACKTIFDSLYESYTTKSFVVYNTIDRDELLRKAGTDNPYSKRVYHIVTVARIENATKRLDRAVRVAKLLKESKQLSFIWHIVGTGTDYHEVTSDIEQYSLSEQVVMEGYRDNPYPYIKNADVLVITSDSEAMPMVLIEAAALGTPVISTDFPAAQELLANGDGIVCAKDENALFAAIMSLLSMPQKNVLSYQSQIEASFCKQIQRVFTEEQKE